MKRMIPSLVTGVALLLICPYALHADVGGNSGLVGYIIGDIYSSLVPAGPVPDNGNRAGPAVNPVNPNVRYVGSPRVCLNLPNGDVNPGTYHGIHRTRVMRQVLVGTETRIWVNDCYVTPDDVDEQYKTVDLGQNVPWNLRFVGSLDYGIYVEQCQGTMKGTTIGGALFKLICIIRDLGGGNIR